ncbi:MAG: flagellar protein [Suilimivivens sp.]
MNVRNCRGCGRLFNYVVGPVICPRCREEREAKFQEVKKYVSEHRGADIMEVSQECDIEPNQIRQWIREERLQFADDSPIMIACEGCGTMIRSGRFCDKCKAEMTTGFKNAMGQNKPAAAEQPVKKPSRDRDKMRFL